MIKHYKPYTPTRRFASVVDYGVLSGVKPMKSALKRVRRASGRNNQGRITMRHQGGGAKKLYRLVDFKQDKLGIPARVETLEYDPYRSAFIMKVLYYDGERRYHIAPAGIKVGDTIVSSVADVAFKPGSRTALKNIPVGYNVYNIELHSGKGGQIVRSAGSQAQVLAQEAGYTHLKMPSGEVRKVRWDNLASVGQVSNPDWNLISIGKAGRSRLFGIRPTVRGTAMNPVDHPYGGGEGRQPRGTKRPKTIWGKVTGGHKTRRRKKYSARLIVSRRVRKSKR
jgi:large subunit ribosomal protein L2